MNLLLKRADPGDIPQIVAFYERETAPDMLRRSAREVSDAVELGVILLCLHDGQIVATSGAFAIRSRKDLYFEYGGTIVTRPFRGFDIQEIFTAARLCFGVLCYPEALPDRVYAFIKPENGPSIDNLKGRGFSLREAAPAPYMKPCAKCKCRGSIPAGRRCCYNIYGIDMDAIRRNVRYFLDASVERRSSKGYRLEITSNLFPEEGQRAILRRFIA
ncbi:hypothetical protein [Paraburkholderia strydomiana]|uniref:hypothetical protein n=1 Tax=Paraburkholderia strydomiana TaxID=1245417 RepID=UPI001BEA4795|nr:hypothetical protein [Paraburkholderia strydomiana]MBT2794291.1 hypothetical protein [Paraburkholderia strydomiana]